MYEATKLNCQASQATCTSGQQSLSVAVNSTVCSQEVATSKPHVKMPKLLAKYSRPVVAAAGIPMPKVTTPLSEYHKYLTLCSELQELMTMMWRRIILFTVLAQAEERTAHLYQLALKVHSVPATAASIECVFSHGGIIVRPHISRMADQTLSKIVYLKCNDLRL